MTAKEALQPYITITTYPDRMVSFEDAERIIILFAKEKVQEALKNASNNTKLILTNEPHPKGWPYLMVNQNPLATDDCRYFVADKQSILDSYDLNNIK